MSILDGYYGSLGQGDDAGSNAEHGSRRMRREVPAMPHPIPWATTVDCERLRKQLDEQVLAQGLRAIIDTAAT